MKSLIVGNEYLNQSGENVKIISKKSTDVFMDEDGREYDKSGVFYSCYEEGNPSLDLKINSMEE